MSASAPLGSAPSTPPQVKRIGRLALNVADLARSCDFYVDALGFSRGQPGPPGGALLTLAGQEITLTRAPPAAAPYPTPRAADDPWFQHFAIAVADMEAAYARLRPHVREPISVAGPELLPPSTGSVTAYKFRDPDGHPLELSFAPQSAWARSARAGGPLFQGLDHTALAVADLEASVAYYSALGFQPGPRLLNRGVEQDRLDGLTGVELDIAVLFTPEPGPHIELLHYRRPTPAPRGRFDPQDVATTRTTLICADAAVSGGAVCDPDGHWLQMAS